jgi:hypothetical protein
LRMGQLLIALGQWQFFEWQKFSNTELFTIDTGL